MTEILNSLLSYLLLVLVIAVLAGIAIFLGITLRKNKNRKEEMTAQADSEKADVEEKDET